MGTIWVAMVLFCIGWHFFYQRKLAEIARRYVHKYCEGNDIQFLSIAKTKSRLRFGEKQGLRWHNEYTFEFSGDRDSKYEGTLILNGTKVSNIDLPVYKVS